MKKLHMNNDAHLKTGFYRIPTAEGTASINVLEGTWYSGTATDDQGNEYTISWALADGYDLDTADDEIDACDWNHPTCIVSEDGREVSAEFDLV